MADDTLKGKVMLVTGGGSGLGEATAHAFAKAGATVACIDLRQEAAQRVSSELTSMGGESAAFGCDVSDAEAVFSTVDAIVKQFGRVDFASTARLSITSARWRK